MARPMQLHTIPTKACFGRGAFYYVGVSQTIQKRSLTPTQVTKKTI